MCMTQGYHIVLFNAQKYEFIFYFTRLKFFLRGTRKGTRGTNWGHRLPFGVTLCPKNMATLVQIAAND